MLFDKLAAQYYGYNKRYEATQCQVFVASFLANQGILRQQQEEIIRAMPEDRTCKAGNHQSKAVL